MTRIAGKEILYEHQVPGTTYGDKFGHALNDTKDYCVKPLLHLRPFYRVWGF